MTGSPKIDWLPPGRDGELPLGVVHLWRCELDTGEESRFREVLSQEEIQRADRFHQPLHQRRFAAGRGSLRMILGRYLKADPARLRLSYSEHGKPFLADHAADIHFNLSHSGELMVVAICRDGPVGVDIEKLDPRLHAMDIADRYFAASERAELALRDGAGRLHAFLELWTAKEAVVKAGGLGIALGLRDAEIGLNPLRLIASNDLLHLKAFQPDEGWLGTAAGPAEALQTAYFQWESP